jgi:hypothetical protein
MKRKGRKKYYIEESDFLKYQPWAIVQEWTRLVIARFRYKTDAIEFLRRRNKREVTK